MKVEIRTESNGVCYGLLKVGECFKYDSRYFVKTDKQGLSVHLASGACHNFESTSEVIPCHAAKVVIE